MPQMIVGMGWKLCIVFGPTYRFYTVNIIMKDSTVHTWITQILYTPCRIKSK